MEPYLDFKTAFIDILVIAGGLAGIVLIGVGIVFFLVERDRAKENES